MTPDNDHDMMYEQGMEYFNGYNGVVRNKSLGFTLLRTAADHGNMKAQHVMGTIYMFGYGVEDDYHLAVNYYRMAADQGYWLAFGSLSECYAKGLGVDINYDIAYEYANKGDEKGCIKSLLVKIYLNNNPLPLLIP